MRLFSRDCHRVDRHLHCPAWTDRHIVQAVWQKKMSDRDTEQGKTRQAVSESVCRVSLYVETCYVPFMAKYFVRLLHGQYIGLFVAVHSSQHCFRQ